jgi:ubiquinol-cytochrome c reductase iron-sulfur subunit
MADSAAAPHSAPNAGGAEVTKRDFLKLVAGAGAAVGVGAIVWPLVDSMNPAADVLALSSTTVDLTPVVAGQAITVMWRGKPVFVRHRTAEEIQLARSVDVSGLPDPQADATRVKAGKDEWLIVVGICTHLGCVPLGNRATEARGNYGGWFCPCHGSHYDTSGRIRLGPAPTNLAVPPYAFEGDTKIKIG